MTIISSKILFKQILHFYRGGHTTIAKILLHHSSEDLIGEVDVYGRTGLIQAASGGYVECAALLIDNVKQFLLQNKNWIEILLFVYYYTYCKWKTF